ncbi:homeobox-leucine zipper protein ROC6-like [Phalaenopsis equestris]|uniref:homeobox-leucine zipper protein ROC6-like n=1 Tax=Phalaenopsis equestris TaxID=78828 RepID=UPI0009E4C041|nr:homeobox-leucine zipper protein ROC6-like [Phalaenopsis equestris]
MSFDGLFDSGGSGALPPYSSGGVQQTRFLSNPVFSTPGLSLGLQMNTAGQGDMSRLGVFTGGVGDVEAIVKSREEENESRSGGSDNLEGGSGDDIDQENPRKKKRYHRHTPQQIQELEALFKECPHPDEKQRMELSKRLNLDPRQVKFWFQNRRTQMKTQIERHENSILRSENDKLRAENLTIREAMRSPVCGSCGSPAMLGEVSLEEQQLRIENARLKDELDRVCALASRFLGRPMSALSSPFSASPLELGVGFTGLAAMVGGDYTAGSSMPQPPRAVLAGSERSLLLELALAAMDELVKLAQVDSPFWIPNIDGRGEVLNLEEYTRALPRCVAPKPADFFSEATRDTAIVLIDGMILVDTFMDANRWAKMFPCVVAKAATIDIISSGMGGTRNGAFQLMQAELQVLTPLVPVRAVSFLRFCKQHAEGVWAVVDVSVDGIRESLAASGSHMSCRRLPSGYLVQAMPSGYSKVTWIEHAEYDETAVHQLYRPPLRAGICLGARRWISALQRQSEYLAIMSATSPPPSDNPAITVAGKRSMMRLAGRMTENFCAGVCAWAERKWRELRSAEVGEDMVRVMTRQSVDDPGEPPGVVLSAATSVWLPMVSAQRLFEFLRDEQLRREWDILSNGGPMQEVAHIAKGHDRGNSVSLLRATVPAAASAMDANGNQKQEEESMLILQETSTDAAGSLVVYAPVDAPAINLVMNGGDSSYVALLPSGFSILPDGSGGSGNVGGSLLTVAFQILVSTLSTAELTVQSVDTVKSLISCTVLKIKSALTC